MNLREVLDLVTATGAAGWHELDVTPGLAALTAFADTRLWSEGGEQRQVLELMWHYGAAVNIEHPEVTIAWGMKVEDELHFEFAEHFANRRVDSIAADINYFGALIHREQLLAVDGGRAYLPMPRMMTVEVSPGDYRQVGEEVSAWRTEFARLLDQLGGRHSDFDRYLNGASFVIVPGHPLDRN